MSRPLRCGLVLAATSTASAGLAAWLLPTARALTLAGGGLEERLSSGCAVAGLLATAWLWLVVVGVVVDAARTPTGPVPDGRWPVAPAPLRRALLSACGVASLAALTVPAADGHTPGGQRPAVTVGSVVAGVLRPDGGVGTGTAHPRRPAHVGHGDPVVTVRRGDCLWTIAAGDLSAADAAADAADAVDVDRRWREIYAANRGVIGPDPDLIHPAQRLRLPR